MELSTRLQDTIRKLESLHAKMQHLEADRDRLRAENTTLKQELDQYAKGSLASATENISEHAPQGSNQEQQGVRAALDQDIRQQIDHYLKELDKCIEWLGQQ
jgi:regulator of replication initiation timing